MAGLGSILASVAIHNSDEIDHLQKKLQNNIALFDSLVKTPENGDGLPIRFIPFGSEKATIKNAQALLGKGYYTSALFFPVIAKNKAGLRIMIRANMEPEEIIGFGKTIKELEHHHA